MVRDIGKEAVPPEGGIPDESSTSKRLVDSYAANKTMKKSEMKRQYNEMRNAKQAEQQKAVMEQQIKAKRQQKERDSGKLG